MVVKSDKIYELLWLSIKNSFSGKLWKWLLGGSGGLSAILFVAKNSLGTSGMVSIKIGIVVLLSIFVLRFIIFLIINLVRYFHYIYQESIYGDAIILLKDAFASVHKLRKRNPVDDRELMAAMLTICNNLKIIFDKITHANSSVSIKVPLIGPVSANTVLMNLCRDKAHSLVRDTAKYKETQHTIIGNTSFQVPLNNVLKGDRENFCYLNNDIDTTPHYQNTSRDAFPNGVLPYKSELVYPIIPSLSYENSNSDEAKNQFEIWGFLCVDCDLPGKFSSKYDVAIMEGVADGVFDVIMERNKIINQNSLGK